MPPVSSSLRLAKNSVSLFNFVQTPIFNLTFLTENNNHHSNNPGLLIILFHSLYDAIFCLILFVFCVVIFYDYVGYILFVCSSEASGYKNIYFLLFFPVFQSH